MGKEDFPEVNCTGCKGLVQVEDDGDISFPDLAQPFCFTGNCPTGYDLLLPEDIRVLEIRGLLIGLHSFRLSDRICSEYDVTRHDLRLLAELEELIKELHPPKESDHG